MQSLLRHWFYINKVFDKETYDHLIDNNALIRKMSKMILSLDFNFAN